MADRLQAELAQMRLELQQLKERMETGAVTVHKDLSLVSLIPKWSGSDSTISLEEFFSSIESSGKIANWKQTNTFDILLIIRILEFNTVSAITCCLRRMIIIVAKR